VGTLVGAAGPVSSDTVTASKVFVIPAKTPPTAHGAVGASLKGAGTTGTPLSWGKVAPAHGNTDPAGGFAPGAGPWGAGRYEPVGGSPSATTRSYGSPSGSWGRPTGSSGSGSGRSGWSSGSGHGPG
jgi:hypothetical protein